MAAKLKPCPLCGRRASATKVGPKQWNIHCGHPSEDELDDRYGCGLVLFGDYNISRAKVVERWNNRASERNSDDV